MRAIYFIKTNFLIHGALQQIHSFTLPLAIKNLLPAYLFFDIFRPNLGQ
ncbi:hypothetical protein VAE151_550579 [Vibrio aestuarianus]|nr:hypothetical protein VAE032_270580 [Vibrio aestuarianus]CAH8198786.1 hypothetical protein VAE128_460583 [Vibrio aestuarianus]CAH8199264.1 hypothetical protein VAE115_320580 [Vibrio aestuarianus]CAH8210601.1 hypothetical protein VAE151_550579 [Vibrio aestuarianus]